MFNLANIDLVKSKEDSKISLRKKNLENILHEKRIKMTSANSMCEVNVQKLNISQEIKAYDFSNPDFSLQLKEVLLSNSSLDLTKFALVQVRDNIRKQDKDKDFLSIYMNNGFVEIIINLLTYNDINILVIF